ncbi:hypothetical protein MMC34_006349 [Xylographa carneopallida]|nr:hypothetical protein [Xylographa carneopallida]
MHSPATPRRTSNRCDGKTTPLKSKPLDVGSPLGPYDTNTVRDRVRQWQAQGGGVITAPDIYAEEENMKQSGKTTTTTPKKVVQDALQHDKADTGEFLGSPTSAKRSGCNINQAGVEEHVRCKSGSAPRKRVVSDGHWRKKRSPPRTVPRVAKEPSTMVYTDDGIRVTPIPEPSQKSIRVAQRASKPKRKSTSQDNGPYDVPQIPQKLPERLQPPGNDDYRTLSENSDEGRQGSTAATPTTTRKSYPRAFDRECSVDGSSHSSSSTGKSEPRRQSAVPRRYADTKDSPRSASKNVVGNPGSRKSSRGKILSLVFDESKKIFSRAEPISIPTPRLPSIEAWLSETPDPFFDDEELPVEMPAPLKMSSKRIKKVEELVTEDPNKIWETIETTSSARVSNANDRMRRRTPSSVLQEDNPFPRDFDSKSPLSSSLKGGKSAAKLVDLVEDLSETSSCSLRRGGGNQKSSSSPKERSKMSLPRKSLIAEDEFSVISSENTTSSVEPSTPLTPLRPPGLNVRRPFPHTGKHKLSTIASVETFETRKQNATTLPVPEVLRTTQQPRAFVHDDHDAKYEATDHFDVYELERRTSKSRLAKHSDLISALSLPMGRSRSIQSARSIRTNRSRLANATTEDLMKELRSDESKYMRELRTLVGGVIPVLLSCVLKKSDSAVAAGLFAGFIPGRKDPNFTKPILDMGIGLERLKSLHKRIPLQDVDALLSWAQGAQRVYSEYLQAWRMGFQDVVVNLAPAAAGSDSNSGARPTEEEDGIDGGLPRNENGDVVDANGERVDVAYLLKRPLVRLKYLAKTLKGVNFVKPSAESELLATKYQNLVTYARHRSNEERARLEDQAAASIDATRARDPRTLGPLAGVTVDQRRRVRARDYFNLSLQHSSGQKIDCRVELLLRDDSPGMGTSGDLLICEVDSTGRWLLFPPVQFNQASARNGDIEKEIIVMITGFNGQGDEWYELLSLYSVDEPTGFEWVQMLGLLPIPPKVPRSQSFLAKDERRKTLNTDSACGLVAVNSPVTPVKSRTPSPRDIEVPIGEQPVSTAKTWIENPTKNGATISPVSSVPRERARLQKKRPGSPTSPITQPVTSSAPQLYRHRSSIDHQHEERGKESIGAASSPRSLNEALRLAGTSASGLKRRTAKRHSRHADNPSSPTSPTSIGHGIGVVEPSLETPESLGGGKYGSAGLHSLSPPAMKDDKRKSAASTPSKLPRDARPSFDRARSSTPSLELPIIPKIRKESSPPSPSYELEVDPEWPEERAEEKPIVITPARLIKKRPVSSVLSPEKPPPAPVHATLTTTQVSPQTPDLGPVASRHTRRRSSSPLKHEYEPSTASESSSDSDASTVERNEATSISDSSEDEELEDGDAPTPLVPLGALQRLPKVSPQVSLYSLPNGTLSPSQSASQAPFKRVPCQPNKASKTIGTIFFWSEKGSWQTLHPDECSVVVTPGLIEAFEMSAAHSQWDKVRSGSEPDADTTSRTSSVSQASQSKVLQPLIALELTPLVPLRRGTALDISIRSPPTAESKITTISNNNIMFRSRNPEECEALYALINHARINNPTYIALQNARITSSFAPSFDRSHSTRGARSTSWFGLGHGSRSSYRASSAPTPSISMSDSSIGSMSSAFSALKRFSAVGRFSIARSTVVSRNGSRAASVYTSSDNSGSSGATTPNPNNSLPADDGKLPSAEGAGPIGLSNAKIRLYIRETASKWRDLGSARLTIMRPTNDAHPVLVPGNPPQQKQITNDKRIVIIGKAKGETLLDVTLGESCFERVARTGIAVSVWEAFEGGLVAKEGGVVGGKLRVFMIQMKGEAETAYTFSIVGKLRY